MAATLALAALGAAVYFARALRRPLDQPFLHQHRRRRKDTSNPLVFEEIKKPALRGWLFYFGADFMIVIPSYFSISCFSINGAASSN
jgi:predicted RNA-binding protein